MSDVAEELLPIDLDLRLVFYGLECALSVQFVATECERVFRDSIEDQVSAKQYEFIRSNSLTVAGRVDDNEPETIWLRVEGTRGIDELLRRVIDRARAHGARLRRALDEQRPN
jgi:hypothetical protein